MLQKNTVVIAAATVGFAALAFMIRRRRRLKPKATIKLLEADPVVGQEKYLGGVLGGDRMIYCIPGHARQVLRINPETDEISYIGPVFNGKYKWLRGVLARDGAIYGIPCHAESVLKIVPSTGEVTTIGGPFPGKWKWHGAVLGADDCIYGIPQKHEAVLKIDVTTQECSLIGGPFPGTNKWYGGLLGGDGNIYGIPQNADSVIKINVETNECSLIGKGSIGEEGGYKWHGGNVGVDGCIYGIPCHADSVLRVDVWSGEVGTIGGGGSVLAGKARPSGKYKYLGGVNGSDGCIYAMPSDADRVLKIDVRKQEVTTIGASLEGQDIVHTKWQNGFLGRDNCIYGIPLAGRTVLKIDLDTQEVTTEGGPFVQLSKWEGGVVASGSGALYCMPMCSKHVLKIAPVDLQRREVAFTQGWGDGKSHD